MQGRIAGVVGEVEAGHVEELESSASSREGDICDPSSGLSPTASSRSAENAQKSRWCCGCGVVELRDGKLSFVCIGCILGRAAA